MSKETKPILLIPMNEEAFSKYLQRAIPAYAQDNVDSGRWDESDALERSKNAHDDFLPDGVETEDHYLFNIQETDGDNEIGYIWVRVEENVRTTSAFIYDLEIYEAHRRRGYAKAALAEIETVVADLGATSLGLHVFHHNKAALALYNSVGFQTMSHNMQKAI